MAQGRKSRDDGEGSAYPLADGRWRAELTVGWELRPDGTRKRLRKYVTAASEPAAKGARKELLRKRAAGELIDRPDITVATWLGYWLDTICVERGLADSTMASYRNHVEKWIAPTIGDLKLTELQPEHPEKVYRRMREAGASGSHQLGAHRTLSRALKVAMRRGRTHRNVCDLIDAPSSSRTEAGSLTPDEARAVLQAAAGRWNGARWSVALSVGMRQSEALGLLWESVDLDAGTVTVRWQLARSYRGSGVQLKEPKSARSKRTVVLPASLVGQLRQHRKAQQEKRLQLGPGWVGSPLGDLVFTRPDGRHLDHSDDWEAWGALLDRAKVRYVKPHEARHTAATLMLVQGISPRVVQQILGHSTVALTLGTYSHVVQELADDAASAMDGALFGGTQAAGTLVGTAEDDPVRPRAKRPRRSA
jgi:integrase